jgi:hypothetical protein
MEIGERTREHLIGTHNKIATLLNEETDAILSMMRIPNYLHQNGAALRSF